MVEGSSRKLSAAASKINDAWFAADKPAYVAHVAAAAMQALTLKDASGQSALDALLAAHAKNTDPAIKAMLERALYTIDGMQQNSQYKPDSTKLAQRQLEQREARVFQSEADNKTTPLIKEAIRGFFNKMVGDLQMTAEERASYLEDGQKNWMSIAGKNPRFMRALAASTTAKNLKEIEDLTKEYRGEFAAEAVKMVYRSRIAKLKENIKKDASSRTEGSGAGSTTAKNAVKWTGATANNGMPNANFDFARMRAENVDIMETRSFYVKGDAKLYQF